MENSLVKIIENSEIDKTQSQVILESFIAFFQQAQEWETKAKTIVITDVSQKAEMKQAREARLALKKIRCDAEDTRKNLKEQSLRVGKAIDGIANVIKALVTPIEEHLEKQEKFVENLEIEKKEKLNSERVAQLSQYILDVSLYNLKEMSEEGFKQLLESSKIAYEARVEAERKAEEERIAKEKAEKEEQERIKAENEKLKAEAIEREKQIAAERAKAQAEAEAKARVEAELRAKEEAEAEKQREFEEAKRLAQLAPDKDKLLEFANSITLLEFPELESENTKKLMDTVRQKLVDLNLYIVKEIGKL
jgi:colicin import membrane protein